MGHVLGVLLPALTLIAPGFVHEGICPDGRYTMQLRRPELPRIVIEGNLVSIDGTCPPTAAEIGSSADGTTVRVEWPACERPFRGRMRLKAVIDRTCTRMTGAIRRSAATRRFSAGRFSTCGNGVVESFERCDDHNTVGGDCCSATCGLEYGPACSGGCRTDADCTPDAYCATAFDCCGGGGVCVVRPATCTDLYDPQCGCDRNLYVNECAAAAAGASLLDLEHCQRTCGAIAGIECPAGQLCDLPERSCGSADLGRTCAIVPTSCPRNGRPVCGCNGATYPNDCVRLMKRVQKAHDGRCAR
jgi:cysteine-rich repeat protein